jgi:FkbM family methyltransferase
MLQDAKKSIGAIASRFGYAIVPKWRLPNLEFAAHLRQVLDRYDIGCVVDVGANTGQYGRFLRDEVGFRGLIVSIEPIPECWAALRRTAFGDEAWLTLNCALGATDAEAEFNVMADSMFSSFLEPDNACVPGMATANRVRGRISVAVRRLDAVLAEIEQSRQLPPLYLKLDTQGFDLQVLEGAGAALGRVSALQTELSVMPIYRGMPDWQTAIAMLRHYGFAPSGLWAVNRDPALQAIEFDCVMVRPAPAAPSGASSTAAAGAGP